MKMGRKELGAEEFVACLRRRRRRRRQIKPVFYLQSRTKLLRQ